MTQLATIPKKIIIDLSVDGISYEDDNSIVVSQRHDSVDGHLYRIKEYMSVYDPYFSTGLGWIYCTNYHTLEDAKIILADKIEKAKGEAIVYVIDKPE